MLIGLSAESIGTLGKMEVDMRAGALLAVDHINEQGGIYGRGDRYR